MPRDLDSPTKNEVVGGLLLEQYGSHLKNLTKSQKLLLIERISLYLLIAQESKLSKKKNDKVIDFAHDLYSSLELDELEEFMFVVVSLLNEPKQEIKPDEINALFDILNASDEMI